MNAVEIINIYPAMDTRQLEDSVCLCERLKGIDSCELAVLYGKFLLRNEEGIPSVLADDKFENSTNLVVEFSPKAVLLISEQDSKPHSGTEFVEGQYKVYPDLNLARSKLRIYLYSLIFW